MKKTLFTLSFLFSAVVSFAQIQTKSVLLGGQIFYYNGKFDETDYTNTVQTASIGLSLGKAFRENRISGLNVNFSLSNQKKYPDANDTLIARENRVDVGGFFREYKKLAGELYFFTQLDGAVLIGNSTEDYTIRGSRSVGKQRGAYLSLTPGIAYQVFKKMHLELTIPNIVIAQYVKTTLSSGNPQARDVKRKQFLFSSTLVDNTALGWLGVGFRFVL